MRAIEKKSLKAFVGIALFAAMFWQAPFAGASSRERTRLVYEKNSLYQQIFVYQRGSVVTLKFGRRSHISMQSQVDLSDLRLHTLEYSRMMFCGLLYQAEPKRVLVIGLGGGVIPRELHHYLPDAEIDVVEIDSDVVPIAERYFGFFQDDRLRVHVDDGRMFVKKHLRRGAGEKYDLVILDAFNGDYIPFHLMTKEFLEEVKGVLADDGVVVANVFASNRLFDAEHKTFLEAFGRCQAFLGSSSTNAMLVSPGAGGSVFTTREEALKRAKMLQEKYEFAFDMATVAGQLRIDRQPDERAEVLTDDRAPVNYLRAKETGD